MGTVTFDARFKLKYDTYEHWYQKNVVLLAGEFAVVEIPASTGAVVNEPAIMLKVGDGTKAFRDLPWATALAGDVPTWAKAASKPTYNANEISGLSDYISGAIQDTDTQYKLTTMTEGNTIKIELSAKAKGGDWAVQDTISIVEDTLVEGTANGTVSFNGADVKVHGLGTAAYKAEGDFAPSAGLTALTTRVDAVEQDKADKTLVDEKIAAAVSSVYRPAGSVAFAGLPALTKANLGKMYNITDAFTTTDSFIEGAGKQYPAGTNVAVVEASAGVYKYDAQAGFVDLSGHATKEYADKAGTDAKTYADGLNTAMDTRVKEVEKDKHTHANKAVLDGITAAKISGWDGKTDDSALAGVAKSGNIKDLSQTAGDYIIFNCGTATTVI